MSERQTTAEADKYNEKTFLTRSSSLRYFVIKKPASMC